MMYLPGSIPNCLEIALDEKKILFGKNNDSII